MSRQEADRFRFSVDRKLSAEGVGHEDHVRAHAVLLRCVMGVKLSKAFSVLYEADK